MAGPIGPAIFFIYLHTNYIFLISFISEYNLTAAQMIRRPYIAVYKVAILPFTPEHICITIKTTRAIRMMDMIAA